MEVTGNHRWLSQRGQESDGDREYRGVSRGCLAREADGEDNQGHRSVVRASMGFGPGGGQKMVKVGKALSWQLWGLVCSRCSVGLLAFPA